MSDSVRNLVVVAGIVFVGLLAYLVYTNMWGKSFEAGLFEDRSHNYALQFPADWVEATEEEESKVESGFRFRWDVDLRLVAKSPDDQNVVLIVAIDKDSAKSLDVIHGEMLAGIEAGGVEAELNEQVTIGGFETYRLGMGNPGAYMEWVMFESGDVFIVAILVAMEPIDDATFDTIDRTIGSLRPI